MCQLDPTATVEENTSGSFCNRHANEAAYWARRDQLLAVYRDQWVAFAGGQVIASGRSAVEVFHHAQASGVPPFVTYVGNDDEPFRIHRLSFPYDAAYSRKGCRRICRGGKRDRID